MLHPDLARLEQFYLETRSRVASGQLAPSEGMAAVLSNWVADAQGRRWWVSTASPPDHAEFIVATAPGAEQPGNPAEFTSATVAAPAAPAPAPSPDNHPASQQTAPYVQPGPGPDGGFGGYEAPQAPAYGHEQPGGYPPPAGSPPAGYAQPPAYDASGHPLSYGPDQSHPQSPYAQPDPYTQQAPGPFPTADPLGHPPLAQGGPSFGGPTHGFGAPAGPGFGAPAGPEQAAPTGGSSLSAKLQQLAARTEQLPMRWIVGAVVALLVVLAVVSTRAGDDDQPADTTASTTTVAPAPDAPGAPVAPGG